VREASAERICPEPFVHEASAACICPEPFVREASAERICLGPFVREASAGGIWRRALVNRASAEIGNRVYRFRELLACSVVLARVPPQVAGGKHKEPTMADRSIDQNDTQIYGPHASSQIRLVVVGLVPEFDPALLLVADQLDAASAAIAQRVAVAQSHDAGARKVSRGKRAALTSGLGVIRRFAKHLGAHEKGRIDRKTFFPRNGTVAGVGRGAPHVLLALKHLHGELAKKDSPVHDRTRWLKEVGDAIAALEPMVEGATVVRTGRRMTTPEVRAAQLEWLRIYKAARSLVESVLRFSKRRELLRVVFHDLAVPSSTRAIAALPEPAPLAA